VAALEVVVGGSMLEILEQVLVPVRQIPVAKAVSIPFDFSTCGISGFAGDWLVVRDDGKAEVYSPSKFSERFELVE